MGSTSPSIINITGPGFEPDLILTACVAHTSTGQQLLDNLFFSFGCAVNDGFETQRSMSYRNADAVTTTSIESKMNDATVVEIVGSGGSDDIWAGQLTGFTANGFDIDNSEGGGLSGAFGQQMYYIALRFTGNPGLKLFDMEWPTTGDYIQDDIGFKPTAGIIVSAPGVTARNTLSSSGNKSLSIMGFADETIRGLQIKSKDAVTTTAEASVFFDAPEIHAFDTDDPLTASGYVLTPDGWTFTLTSHLAATTLGWALAISGATKGAIFQSNTIVTADPQTFDESPVIGSPADVSYLWTSNPAKLVDNLFLFSEAGKGHAINLISEGEFNVVGNQFDQQWLDGTSPDGNGTSDSALYNAVGQVILNVIDGVRPTYMDKQSPGTTINLNVAVTLTGLQENTEVRVYLAEDFTSPIDTNELAGIEDTGSPSEFTFNAEAGTIVDIVIFNVDYLLPPNNRIKNFTVPTTSTSFPISQILDRNFENP
jgi:hypothetical protein